MTQIENKIRRLSFNQLKALLFICQSPYGICSSSQAGRKLKIKGKPLGGIFSSLSRQKINRQPLIIPVGQSQDGRGLRWKINTNLVSVKKLAILVNELLRFW